MKSKMPTDAQVRAALVLGKAAIYELSDLDLVRAFRHAITETPSLLRTDWEREFASGIEEVFVYFGRLTWKQRRQARLLLIRVVEEAARVQAVRSQPKKRGRKWRR